jgi:hypothetical protein
MIQPIRPVSRKDGSQGLIANVDEKGSPFGNIEDKFERRFYSTLQEYDSSGRIKNSEQEIASGKINENNVLNRNKPVDNAENSNNVNKTQEADESKESNPANNELTEEEKQQVEKLKKIDREVRAHEQAHKAAGGGLVRGGPNYQYQRGPDNRQYAVAGEVTIDMSPVPNNPQKTIQKMQQVRRAALAPADPSPQDRNVAARAQQISAEARRELAQQSLEKSQETSENLTKQNENITNNLQESNTENKNIQRSLIDKYKENEDVNQNSTFSIAVGAATLKK